MDACPGDVHSQAIGINARDQVVGLSCTAHFASCRAFLWQNGTMLDLNLLVSGYSGLLLQALDINDEGTITGLAVDAASGALVTFVARPNSEQGNYQLSRAAPALTMPDAMRVQLLRRWKLDGAMVP